MTWSYEIATDIGKVRLHVGDTDKSAAWTFEDEELQVFLDETGEVLLAAAAALDALAADQARLAMRVSIGDYSEDRGAAVKALHAQAEALRQQAAQTPASEIAETAWTPTARAQMIANERLRGNS